MTQVLRGVDPLDLVLVICPIALDPLARAAEAIDDVRKAVLSRGSHGIEDGEDALGPAHVGAQVELVDRLLRGRCVGGLHDVADPAVLAAPDPAVGSGRSTTAVSSVRSATLRAWRLSRPRIEVDRKSGVSPYMISRSPSKSASCCRTCRTAWPVPLGSSCTRYVKRSPRRRWLAACD